MSLSNKEKLEFVNKNIVLEKVDGEILILQQPVSLRVFL